MIVEKREYGSETRCSMCQEIRGQLSPFKSKHWSKVSSANYRYNALNCLFMYLTCLCVCLLYHITHGGRNGLHCKLCVMSGRVLRNMSYWSICFGNIAVVAALVINEQQSSLLREIYVYDFSNNMNKWKSHKGKHKSTFLFKYFKDICFLVF